MRASVATDGFPASGLERWFYALKPASWPKLFVPAFFGQVLGAQGPGGLELRSLAWGLGFTAFGLAFIVLLNDWGDQRVDAMKRKMFPDGCSPKTIPDGILGARAVAMGGVLFGGAALLAAWGAERDLSRPAAFEAGVGCMLLFVAYTLPPVRLNYRGGGELLEMLGVGVALPLYNAYLQSGHVVARAWPWLAGFAALSLASGVASGLSDERSDRAGGKRTFASVFGNGAARALTETCVLVGMGLWTLSAIVWPSLAPAWAVAPAVAIVLWNFVGMRKVSASAVTNAFAAQGAYKSFLHRAIWHSTTVAAVLLWLQLYLA